jgi:hypothetical protein
MAYTHPGGTRRCLRSGRVSRGPGDDQRTAPLAMAARPACYPGALACPPGGQRRRLYGGSPLAELETCA